MHMVSMLAIVSSHSALTVPINVRSPRIMSQTASCHPETTAWQPSVNPWLIAAAVMLATILEVLDTSVANVAVAAHCRQSVGQHRRGHLGLDQLSGLQRHRAADDRMAVRFLRAEAVPDRLHCRSSPWPRRPAARRRRWASSIFARVAQGAAGGALQPLSQAILMESFPPAKRGMAMAVFGLGVVVAPIIGPVLGGWITDNYSWRWIFFINVPLGALAVLMSQAFVEDPPYLRDAHENRGGKVDYIGFGVLAIWLGTLQIILDRGQEDDWFNADVGLLGVGHLAGVAGLPDRLGTPRRAPAGRYPRLPQPQLRHGHAADDRRGHRALQHHGPAAPVPAGTDGLSGPQQRHGHEPPRHGRDLLLVGGGHAGCQESTRGC